MLKTTRILALTALFGATLAIMTAGMDPAQAGDYYVVGGSGGGGNNRSSDSGMVGNGGGASFWGEEGGWGAGAGAGSRGGASASASVWANDPTTDGTTSGNPGTPENPGVDGRPGIGFDGGHATADGAPVSATGGNAISVAVSALSGSVNVLGGHAGGGGDGNNGYTGGSGGHAGSAALKLTGGGTLGALAITAGNGGDGGNSLNTMGTDGNGGAGGNGGDAFVFVDDAATVIFSSVTMKAGNGGDAGGGPGAGVAGLGGNGGDVVFSATGTVGLTGIFAVVSGTDHDAVAGAATVIIGSLLATHDSAKFTTDSTTDGAYAVTIGSANATSYNLEIDLSDCDVGTSSIGDIHIGAGKTFTLTGEAGVNFALTGGLIAYASTGNSATLALDHNLDMSGKTIIINIDNTFANGGTALTITGGAVTVSSSTQFSIDMDPTTALNSTDTITLIDGTVNGANLTGATVTAQSGATDFVYELQHTVGGAILANINPEASGMNMDAAHNMLLSASALTQLLIGGNDVAADMAGKFAPMSPPRAGAPSAVQYGAYAYLGGGRVKADAGSHIKSNNFHLMVGPGIRFNHAGGARTDVGAFFEAGWGNYDTHNSFRGEGDSRYYGGGVTLRHDTSFGLYGEASFRVGSAKSEFDGVRGRTSSDFDIKSTYYGGHLGLGYIFKLDAKSSFDLSVKGLWTHLDDDDATLRNGSRIRIDETDSFRTQVAAKYSYNFARNLSGYVKAAWEHEFDGETKGRYNATRIRETDMGGSSGIGELGVDWRINDRAALGAAVHGVVGKRRGFGGSVNVSFGF